MGLMDKLFTKGYNQDSFSTTSIKLDSQQQSVVYSTSNNILVVAGAGSGKTRVLTERIKYLIESGVKPSSIIAITFTNLAAEEMRERLKDVPGIGDAFIGTIHSFANKIMGMSGDKYSIYNDDIDSRYHKELIQKYCKFLTFDKYLQYKDLKFQVETGKLDEKELSDFLTSSERAELRLLHRSPKEIESEIKNMGFSDFPESILTMCIRDNVISFDELLIRADKYFRSNNSKVEHLLVDEFQDVGTLEFQFIAGLNANSNFFVGDDYQSIYAFKGGNVSLFLKLVEDSNFDVYYLTNNYRNGRKILELAEVVISQVDRKISKTITPKVDSEGDVKILSKWKLKETLSSIDPNSYKDWFVLTRTNKELYSIVNMCMDLGIPYATFKREGLSLSELNKVMKTNKVKILTVHTSKGLESENVILYGKFPVWCPSYMKSEDERKVMYVGVTRAKNNLIILN